MSRITPEWLKRALYLNMGPLKNPDFWRGLFLPGNKSKINVTEKKAEGLPAFFRALNIISGQMASLPLSVYEEKPDGSIVEAKTHPLYKLLKFRPSPLYNSFDFVSSVTRQVLLRGEAYIIPVYDGRGAVSELVIKNDRPVDFFKFDNTWFYRFADEERPYKWDSVLHLKAFSVDGITGQNPLKIFDEIFGLGIAQVEFASSHFGNGAHYSGLLIPDHPIKPEQQEQLRSTFNSKENKPGETGVLPFGFKYEKISANLADTQLIESRRLTVEDVANITGVHPILLASLERATFSNVEELNRTFVQYTLREWCKRWESELNSKLFSNRELGRYFIRFNLDGMLRGDTEARAKYYQTMYNIRAINPNEIRKLENFNPYEGGNEYGLPLASNTKENERSGEENI
ncbi:MAG: phage portal protein [Flavobacteriaceae bacterium]